MRLIRSLFRMFRRHPRLPKGFKSCGPLLKLLTNHRPVAPDEDYDLWERFELVPCSVSFVNPAPRPAPAEDPKLLRWLIEGARLWSRGGREG